MLLGDGHCRTLSQPPLYQSADDHQGNQDGAAAN
ncbi:hypothetical protein [Schleiferilactobacillus harbinensis]